MKAPLRNRPWRKDLRKIKEQVIKISEKNGVWGRRKETKGLGVKACLEFSSNREEVDTWQEAEPGLEEIKEMMWSPS